ncbi:MAG: carbon-nitrogen family hydrolase [Lachnospiraceae bacterium]|nr:carbon-nitrogen family hydrolase [Lachnospiraceae bacterium]
MKTNIRVIQPDFSGCKNMDERREHVYSLLESLAGQSLDLVTLPELWSVGFGNYDDYEDCAERLNDSKTLDELKRYAREYNTYIFTGSMVEKRHGNLYNTSVLLDRRGDIAARYRKIHLFGYESRESKILTAGEEAVVVETDFGRVGIATCYDLRFPEQFRIMLLKDVEMFIIAADWPALRGEAFRLFCRARALENQSFLVATNCAGGESAGLSCVINPEGEVLAQAGAAQRIIPCEIDLSDAQKYRREFPAVVDIVSVK